MWSSLKVLIIRKLGGYPDIESLLEPLDLKTRYEILTRAVRRHFNTISDEDILRVHESGAWFFEDKPLAEAEKSLLIAEAKQFLSTKLWQVLCADVKWQANRKMYLLAQNEVQIAAGKLWVYTLDCFKTRLESVRKGTAIFNTGHRQANKPDAIKS